MHQIRFKYSPDLSNTFEHEPVEFQILAYDRHGKTVWTFTDLTYAKYEKIIDFEEMFNDITRIANKKLDKQLQLI